MMTACKDDCAGFVYLYTKAWRCVVMVANYDDPALLDILYNMT